ncbi:squalene synthase HpnC [Methylobacillus gramineus]|uniref:squalene synthase HpnC n=1 Tax=Methylobacillus gramineus TaxID=755169 RepID=UPI001CFFFCFC|nr:squalene synthase HpnC [Methylobacillus gramineus]MCB5184427.1 squalene synthase HpnC [Methylobacillus gramineus]
MTTSNPQAAIDASMALAKSHYENFPVASFLLPKHLREPIGLIYSFARQADDFADEGDFSPEQRLEMLQAFRLQLDKIKHEQSPDTELFKALQAMIKERQLPLEPFYDLLSAFSQDVVKARYADFGQVIDYCRRSANPVGRLLLHLYKAATPRNLGLSDAICTSLQLINFLQDVEIDYRKDRIYFPQDEMLKYKITEEQIARQIADKKSAGTWSLFMEFQINRTRRLLQSGAPLGLILPGRIGLEMRSIIAGGERILHKLHRSHGDVFHQRPVLTPRDWAYMLYRAVSKK